MNDNAINQSDLNQLIEDVQSLKRDLASLADHSRGTLWQGATDTANAIGAEAQRLYSGVTAQGQRSADALTAKVEEKPLMSLLIAFGVGFIGGRILPR